MTRKMLKKTPKIQEIRNLLIEIGDLSGQLEYSTCDLFWKKNKYLEPMMMLGAKMNSLTLEGNIPKHAAPGVFMRMCNGAGYYPCRMDIKRMIFVHWTMLEDVRNELRDILKQEQQEKTRKESLKNLKNEK